MKTQLKPILYLVIPVTLFLVIGSVLYVSTGRDDVHITYWSAHSLVKYGDILNYNGDRFEQSSSLGSVLWLAGMYKLTGIDLATLGGRASIFWGVLTIMLSTLLLGNTLRRSSWKILLPSACIAASTFFVYWAWSGMETTMDAFFVLAYVASSMFLVRSEGRVKPAHFTLWGLLVIAYLLIRPENQLVGPIFLVFLILLNPGKRKKGVILIGIIAVLDAILFLFRKWYFGYLFPHPVYVKVPGLSWDKFKGGARYLLLDSLSPDWSFLFLVLLIAGVIVLTSLFLRKRIGNGQVFVLLSYPVLHLAFVLLSGGDWMEGGRMLVPILPLTILVLAIVVEDKPKIFTAIFTTLFVFSLAGNLLFTRMSSGGQPLVIQHDLAEKESNYSRYEHYSRVHKRDIPTISELDKVIGEVYGKKQDKVTIMSGQAGMVMFHTTRKWFGKIYFYDLWSLSTDHFLRDDYLKSLRDPSSDGSWHYGSLFENFESIREHVPELQRPDIIFEIDPGGNRWKSIQSKGYHLVYLQKGKVKTGTNFFPGGDVEAEQFIAVEDRWYKELFEERELRTYQW